MKISTIQGRGIDAVTTDKAAPVESRVDAQSQVTNVAANDTIRLSQEARLMHKAGEIIAQTSDLRLEKINPISLAVQENTYQVDNRRLADSIISYYLSERVS